MDLLKAITFETTLLNVITLAISLVKSGKFKTGTVKAKQVIALLD